MRNGNSIAAHRYNNISGSDHPGSNSWIRETSGQGKVE